MGTRQVTYRIDPLRGVEGDPQAVPKNGTEQKRTAGPIFAPLAVTESPLALKRMMLERFMLEGSRLLEDRFQQESS
jgi:hypothetical protein